MGNAERQIGAGVAAGAYDALFTDLYELTMLQTYFAQGMGEARDHAATELSRLPAHVRAIEHTDPPYAVEVSAALRSYQDEIAQAAVS